MLKTTRRSTAGFTLIELLTVIAIIGILAGIIIPTVGKVKVTASRASDMANLRSIGQASLIYAQSNKDLLPGTKIDQATWLNSTSGTPSTVKIVAGALASGGGLESAKMWISKVDDTVSDDGYANTLVTTVLDPATRALSNNFAAATLAFGYVAGLNTNNYPSTTPIAFTRGIVSGANSDTTWAPGTGTYKGEGGHIVFIGGNVAFYKTIAGELTQKSGAAATRLTDTAKPSVMFIEEGVSGVSSSTAGSGT